MMRFRRCTDENRYDCYIARQRTQHDERGVALMMAMIVVLLVTLMGAAMASESIAGSHNATVTRKVVQVISAARAGTAAAIASVEAGLDADNAGDGRPLTCQSTSASNDFNGKVGSTNGAGNATSAAYYTVYWSVWAGTGSVASGESTAISNLASAMPPTASSTSPLSTGGAGTAYGTCSSGSATTMVDPSVLVPDARASVTIVVAFEAVGGTASTVFEQAGQYQGADTSVTAVELSAAPQCAVCLLGGGTADLLSTGGGSGLLLQNGSIYDSSGGSPAASTNGGGNITATAGEIDVVGSVSGSGFSPAPVTGVSQWDDATLTMPSPSPTTVLNIGAQGNVSCPSNRACTLQPGNYGTVKVNGTLTMRPGQYQIQTLDVEAGATLVMGQGVYALQGGGFTVKGGATVQANGVTLYFTCTPGTCASPGSTGAAPSFAGGSFVTLSAPTPAQCGGQGPPQCYEGIAIWQDPNDVSPMALAGNAGSNLSGTVYAPGAQVTLDGSSGAAVDSVLLDVGSVVLSGNGAFALQADPSKDFTNWHPSVLSMT